MFAISEKGGHDNRFLFGRLSVVESQTRSYELFLAFSGFDVLLASLPAVLSAPWTLTVLSLLILRYIQSFSTFCACSLLSDCYDSFFCAFHCWYLLSVFSPLQFFCVLARCIFPAHRLSPFCSVFCSLSLLYQMSGRMD
jgi:hypothetical protein